MATGRLPDPNTAPVTAKGDLYTYSTVPAKLAVGNNGETLVADSSATTGLRWQSAANTNAIINGGFDIWQRGTSGTANSSSAGAGYNADRWQNYGFGNSITVSRQATGDTTNLPFIQYCARVQRNSGQTGTNAIYAYYTLETADSLRFAGRTVVLSFYARKGANFSATSDALVAQVQSGTGTDQNIPNFTGVATPINGTATLTTTWQRFSFTGTIASTATEVGLSIYYSPTGTASTNDYFEITGVQLEFGSVPTTFKRAGGTLAGELAACQRYYNRLGNSSGNSAQRLGVGPGTGSTNASVTFYLPVNLRTATQTIEYSGLQLYQGTATYAVTSAGVNAQSTQNPNVNLGVASGLTGGQFYEALTTSTSGYIAFNAEL